MEEIAPMKDEICSATLADLKRLLHFRPLKSLVRASKTMQNSSSKVSKESFPRTLLQHCTERTVSVASTCVN